MTSWIPDPKKKKGITAEQLLAAAELMNKIGVTALGTLPMEIVTSPELKKMVAEMHDKARGVFAGHTDDEIHTVNVVVCALWSESLLRELHQQMGIMFNGKE